MQQRKEHADYISQVLNKYGTYTSAKTIPTSVYTEHKNQVDTFSRNFMNGPDYQYASDGSKRNETAADSMTEQTRKPKRDLKEIIELHAEIQ